MPNSAYTLVLSRPAPPGPNTSLYLVFEFQYRNDIVGHWSTKTAKSAKFFIERKTAKFFQPHLADLAATTNL